MPLPCLYIAEVSSARKKQKCARSRSCQWKID